MRILSHALPVYIFDPVCPLFLLLYNPAAPRHYLLTALLYMPKGLFCQIPHRGQRPPSLPYRSPGFQSSLGYNLIPPSPIPKSIHLIHLYLSIYLSINQSLLAFLYRGRLVDLPASPQCGCISVPCCALLVSWQHTTAMTGLQGRESPLLRSSSL